MYSWYPPDVLIVFPRCTEHTLYRVFTGFKDTASFLSYFNQEFAPLKVCSRAKMAHSNHKQAATQLNIRSLGLLRLSVCHVSFKPTHFNLNVFLHKTLTQHCVIKRQAGDPSDHVVFMLLIAAY